MTPDLPRIAMIGFGEAGGAFAQGFGPSATAVAAWDVKLGDRALGPSMADRVAGLGARAARSNADAVTGAGAIFSFVTADQAEAAATRTAASIGQGAWFLDCNSCSPGTKRRNAVTIEAAGGRYVDVAVMAPVFPALHETPLLVSGPHAAGALAALAPLGLKARLLEGEVGRASSTKMVRSIVMKGLEAIVAECVLAGTRAGVIDDVLASLDKTYPGFDWPAKAGYMLERMINHGPRRAAEMREVEKTVQELGLSGAMAGATAGWQHDIGALHLDAGDEPYQDIAARILAALEGEPT